MRIATYNVEWFTGLFDAKDRLLRDGEWSSRHNVTRREQADALGHVFAAMDADAIMVIEAPDASRDRNTLKALMNFADHYDLRANAAVMGFVNETQQEIALLFDPAVMRAEHAPHPATPVLARFDEVQDGVVFSKPPFEVLVETRAGFAFRMIGAHLKSKAPHGAKTPQDVQRIAHENRRKQQAQSRWLRARVDQYLAQGSPLMVLGDLNDGPGLDGPDARAAVSSVEIVLGQGAGALHDPHARMALCGPLAASPTTSRFWIRPEKRYLQALLDYIMVSAELMDRGPRWRIWHPTDDPQCWRDPDLRHALLLASDHFPVTIDLDI